MNKGCTDLDIVGVSRLKDPPFIGDYLDVMSCYESLDCVRTTHYIHLVLRPAVKKQ